jgi:hypothetical protein
MRRSCTWLSAEHSAAAGQGDAAVKVHQRYQDLGISVVSATRYTVLG